LVYRGDERHPGRPGPPQVFPTEAAAEAEARRVLFEALNTRNEIKKRANTKPEISIKMTGDEFAVALAEAEIDPKDIAQMWGTSVERIISWLEGEQDVPFPLRWVLPLLRLPGAKELAMGIVEANVNFKPKWLAFQAEKARADQLRALISDNLPRGADEITLKFERANSEEGLNLRQRLALLEEVAAALGLDVPKAPATADSK